MPVRRRPSVKAAVALLTMLCLALLVSSPAHASRGQLAIFEEDNGALRTPTATLDELKSLGVGAFRYSLHWRDVAPGGARAPAGFNPGDPGSPAYTWAVLDAIVRAAYADGITVDLSVTGGAPGWAEQPGQPAHTPAGVWYPDARQYGLFVQALARRYSGHYVPAGSSSPLPRVGFWELWNEPNFGPDLAPQAVARSSIPTAPRIYRGLVDAAWSALQRSGHARDTVVLGNLDARGESGPPGPGAPQGFPGDFAATKPAQFLRDLYCVDRSYRPVRGRTAAIRGCPATAAGRRRFRAAHPALFAAAGFGDHPYPGTRAPTQADSRDPDFAEFSQLPHFIRVLDRLQRVYGSSHRFGLYDDEFGEITDPPNRSQHFPSPALAAEYLNLAEYVSWLNPRITSTAQFLLQDPDPLHAPEYGGFASGLEFFGGRHKPGYDAYRLPVFVPATRVRRGHPVLVWGCARPAHAYRQNRVRIEFQARGHGPFRLLATVHASAPRGYFEIRVPLASSGVLRLAWTYPGTPGSSPLAGRTISSRTVSVTVR